MPFLIRYTTVQFAVSIFKRKEYFYSARCIKLIKSESKDISIVTKDFELSIRQIIMCFFYLGFRKNTEQYNHF